MDTPSWDVFLSFYGKDTRRNFTSHLYRALDEAGIKTFMDDPELDKGEEISSGLLAAIHSSKMFVVVLSENYAYSSWCLNELVEILSCKRTKNQVVPVFYHVDPSDLRYHKGSFEVALETHKKRRSVDIIDNWRSALAQIAELSGYHLKKDGNQTESEIVQEIVEYLAPQASTNALHLDEYLFGIDSAVEEIYQKLRMESNDVRAIGICGMGGIGKTTIAKSFYNKYSNNFDISCFVENVKQDSQGGSPLLPLLEKLLTGLMRKKDYKVHNIVNGITQLKRILRFKKALVVVDDLDQSSYSELLVRLPDSFSAGSRIIITTRDANLLNQIKVDISQVEIYMVKKLEEIDSLELFSYHAFNKTMPPERFRELSIGFVTYAGGLPLALKVLGSSLCGRTHVSFWNAKLEKVRKIPENEIQKILQLSYDELSDETQKTIFLDIVFFFVGKDKDEAFHIFESCDFFPEFRIPILVDRCLLIIDKDKKFQMHNLIQDMGMEVIREESEHGKLRRLHLCQENAIQTLKNLEGTNKIEVLILDLTRWTNKHFGARIFERLPNLRLLEIIGAHDIKDDFKNCFHELRCIRWSYCPWRHVPSSFRPQKLVSFDMQYNQFKTLWKDMPPVNLKTINVSYSRNLKTTCDFRDMKLIERLSLRGCQSLLVVHPSIGQLNNLGHLDLSNCSHLKQLPEQLGDMKGLRKLDASYTTIEQLPDSIVHLKELVHLRLYHCKKLNKLPEQIGNLEGLRKFDASHTAIEQLPNSFGRLINLVDLQLPFCKNLNSLPNSIWKLKFLQALYLHGCLKLRQLPEQLGKMQCLKHLDASRTAIEKLPYSIGQLNKLKWLDASFTAIEELPDSIGQLSKLEWLNLRECNKLKYVPSSIGNLLSLRDLELLQEGVVYLPDMVENIQLRSLSLRCNIRLCLPMIQSLSFLRTLEITDDGHSFSSSEPFSLSKLSNLGDLILRNLGGSSFPELPLNLELLSVKEFAKVEQLPDLSSFKQLKRLNIERCSSLQSLPPLPPHLQVLFVVECRSLQDVPDLSMLKELSDLWFTRCSSLKLISLKESSLQVRDTTYSSFKAILPNREIGEWFNFKSRGRTICFDIPPTLGQDNFLGLAFWVVYRCKKPAVDSYDVDKIRVVITNKTEGITINHHIFARTTDIGDTLSSVECTSGIDISVKSEDRIKVSFQSLLYEYSVDDDEYVPSGGEVKVEMCGVHVIQRTPSTPYYMTIKDDRQSAITTTGLRNDHLHWVWILAIGLLTFFFIHLSFQTFM